MALAKWLHMAVWDVPDVKFRRDDVLQLWPERSGMHGLSHFGGGRGFGGKMGGAVAAMAIFGLALDAMSR